jgi:hypothetical protein
MILTFVQFCIEVVYSVVKCRINDMKLKGTDPYNGAYNPTASAVCQEQQ